MRKARRFPRSSRRLRPKSSKCSTRTTQIRLTRRRLCSTGVLSRKTNFAKLNTKEMFKDVDADGNGKIELKEWLSFWRKVKKAGHPDSEILEELTNIREGRSWVGFGDVNPKASSQD